MEYSKLWSFASHKIPLVIAKICLGSNSDQPYDNKCDQDGYKRELKKANYLPGLLFCSLSLSLLLNVLLEDGFTLGFLLSFLLLTFLLFQPVTVQQVSCDMYLHKKVSTDTMLSVPFTNGS